MLFKNVAGQSVIKEKLINNIRNNRVSHAQLFLGPEGSGKLALALAYVQYLNCHKPTELDSCGECPSCTKFGKLIHPDLHMFYPVATNKEFTKDVNSSTFINHWRGFVNQCPYFGLMHWYLNIGIENKQGVIKADDCNEIIRLMSLKPYESPYKTVIIWMVEKLYHAAAPKLLKILEEPPEKTLFFLIAEDQEQILKTIISRTQVLKIPPISEEDTANYLKLQCSCEHELAEKIAFISAGNMAEAIRLSVEGLDAVDAFGVFRNWMRACYSFKVEDILSIVDDISKFGREKQKNLLSYSIKMIRRALLISQKVETSSVNRLEGDEKTFLIGFSKFINTLNINDINSLFQESYSHIERNANPKILFADLSFKMTNIFRAIK